MILRPWRRSTNDATGTEDVGSPDTAHRAADGDRHRTSVRAQHGRSLVGARRHHGHEHSAARHHARHDYDRSVAPTGQTARTRAALATVADMSTLQFPGCAAASAVTDTVRSTVDVPTDYTATVTKIDYLLPSASTCTPTTSVIKVTVEVSHPKTGTSVQGEVVLRDRAARPS